MPTKTNEATPAERTRAARIAAAAAREELSRVEADADASPTDAAKKRLEARETLAVLEERHTRARIAEAAAQAAELGARAAVLKAEAEELDRKAAHFTATAVGQVDGLFGPNASDILAQRNRRPVRAVEMENEALGKRGEADALEADARSLGGAL